MSHVWRCCVIPFSHDRGLPVEAEAKPSRWATRAPSFGGSECRSAHNSPRSSRTSPGSLGSRRSECRLQCSHPFSFLPTRPWESSSPLHSRPPGPSELRVGMTLWCCSTTSAVFQWCPAASSPASPLKSTSKRWAKLIQHSNSANYTVLLEIIMVTNG